MESRMKISFVNPPGFVRLERPPQPLGAVTLCTILRDAGHEVRFYDYQLGPLPEAEILDCDVLCLTGLTHQMEGIGHWITLGQKHGIRVLAGGTHATIVGGIKRADCSVVGHAEDFIVDAVEGRLNGIVAGSYENLDAWPIPDRGAYGWTRYTGEEFFGMRAIRVIGYIGCPYKCKFCCEPRLHGGRTKFRDPARIEAEIREEKRRLDMKAITISAATFTVRREWAIEVSQRLKSIGLPWQTTTRVDHIDVELARIMKDCGCVTLGLGIESGSDTVLKVIGKGTTSAQAKAAAAMLREAGLPFNIMLIPYLPGETPQTMDETDRLVAELKAPHGVCRQRFSPLLGSEFCGDMLAQYGRLVPRAQVFGSFGEQGFIPHGF
jgi:radical SAM superfamily enzyme YgiQ (UPF0313 family)